MLSGEIDVQLWVRRMAAMLAVVAVAAVGRPAAAQDGESDSQASGAETGQADNSSGGDSAGSSQESGQQGGQQDEQAAEEEGPDPDDPHYWAKVRKVHTVQKREFQKVGRFGISAYGGLIPNNIFERYYPVGVRLNYFILENIGLELAGSRALRAQTPLEGVMNEGQGINAETVRVADTQVWHTNFGILWSPLYGKTSFYESAINYFDVYLFGGAGMVVTKTPEFANQPLSDIDPQIKPEGVLGAGVSFFVFDGGVIRADFRQFLFQKVPPENGGPGGVANPSEVSLGFGWFF